VQIIEEYFGGHVSDTYRRDELDTAGGKPNNEHCGTGSNDTPRYSLGDTPDV